MASFPEAKRFEAQLGKKPFLVTVEVAPPKGTDLAEVLHIIETCGPFADAMNVTDGQSAMMRACPLAVSKVLLDHGVDPIYQLTCRDRNRIGLQADLLGASILGIRNILALTGDDPKAGDHPEAKPVFDLNANQLMAVARGLEAGKDMAGKELTGTPHFCIGGAANPGNPKLDEEVAKLNARVENGVKFFQSQAIFEVEPFRKYMAQAKQVKAPILAGILLLKSAKMARYMNEHVWGIKVPESLIERMEQAADKKQECVKICVELISGIKDVAGGIHLYGLGWEDLIPTILKEARVA